MISYDFPRITDSSPCSGPPSLLRTQMMTWEVANNGREDAGGRLKFGKLTISFGYGSHRRLIHGKSWKFTKKYRETTLINAGRRP